MQKAQDAGSAEIWTAAHHRRTEDLADWLRTSFKRNERSPAPKTDWDPPEPRLALMRGLTVAIIAFVALISVSAGVHAKKRAHIALRPTAVLPAVNVP
jgi:hypothetical protein